MTDTVKKEIEALIDGWYFDDDSYQHVFDFGTFLLGFTKYLHTLNKSESGLKKHKENVSLIGYFHCNYSDDLNEPFECANFAGGFFFSSVYFESKVSNAPSAIDAYAATWNLLDNYIVSKTYINFKIE
jgi:hypothetical protein